MMRTATTTSVDASDNNASKRRNGNNNGNGNGTPDLVEAEPKDGTTVEKLRTVTHRKYRHVAAVHSKVRPSCLSHDSHAAPSFIGFRNLMVIVLGKLSASDENTDSRRLTSY